MTSAASLSARDAFCSPSAAITYIRQPSPCHTYIIRYDNRVIPQGVVNTMDGQCYQQVVTVALCWQHAPVVWRESRTGSRSNTWKCARISTVETTSQVTGHNGLLKIVPLNSWGRISAVPIDLRRTVFEIWRRDRRRTDGRRTDQRRQPMHVLHLGRVINNSIKNWTSM